MSKHRLLYYTTLRYQPESLELLRRHFEVIEVDNPDSDSDVLLASVEIVLAPLGYRFDRQKIDKCKLLKVIGSNTTGHPHIDVEHARAKGVKVVTLKHEREFLDGITPTAEFTWGLIIALTRRLLPAVRSTARGSWDRRPYPGTKMLSRMSIGIVGLGRLGYRVAQYALKFGMEVSYFDPYRQSAYPGLKQRQSLEELVSDVDVVSVHVPHEKHTEGMFSEEIFATFKMGSFFINTSRGELVDHNALLSALRERHLSGAAIDVFEGEFEAGFASNFKRHALWRYAQQHDNLIISPHIGGSTLDAWSSTEQHTIMRMLQAFGEGNPLVQSPSVQTGDAWAVIPARGGSKSIPLKNLVKLNGRALIDYAFTASRSSTRIKRIICSTDSLEIGEYSRAKDIEVDRRPASLASDNVATVDVLLDLVRRRLSLGEELPEYLVLLEPTSPFVIKSDIEACLSKLDADVTADSAQTVTAVSSNSHAYNQRYHDTNGSNFLFTEERKFSVNKQSKPKLFIHGNVRVMRTVALMRNGSIFGDRSLPIEIPRVRAMDVDDHEDLEFAEAIIAAGMVPELE